jgi:hypothetical protein
VSTNPASVRTAVDNLIFHNYSGLQALLLTKTQDAVSGRKVLLATALWRVYQYEKSLEILLEHTHGESECVNIVFLCLGDFKDNVAAKTFILQCMAGDDEKVILKAKMTLGIWAYSGMPSLRENNLLEALQPSNKDKEAFKEALKQLALILNIW